MWRNAETRCSGLPSCEKRLPSREEAPAGKKRERGNPLWELDHTSGDRSRCHPSQIDIKCKECHALKSQLENVWRERTGGRMLPPPDEWKRLAADGKSMKGDAARVTIDFWLEKSVHTVEAAV